MFFFFFLFPSLFAQPIYTLASIDCSSWRYPRENAFSDVAGREEGGRVGKELITLQRHLAV